MTLLDLETFKGASSLTTREDVHDIFDLLDGETTSCNFVSAFHAEVCRIVNLPAKTPTASPRAPSLTAVAGHLLAKQHEKVANGQNSPDTMTAKAATKRPRNLAIFMVTDASWK